MWVDLRYKLAKIIAPELVAKIDELEERTNAVEQDVNQRIARAVLSIDPIAELLKEFHGVFTETLERPEDKLTRASQIEMSMMGWRVIKDPMFNYFMDWIMNTHANAAFKSKIGTNEQIIQNNMYARAQVSVSLLLKRELGRLSRRYEELLAKGQAEFNSATSVE